MTCISQSWWKTNYFHPQSVSVKVLVCNLTLALYGIFIYNISFPHVPVFCSNTALLIQFFQESLVRSICDLLWPNREQVTKQMFLL